MISAAGRAGSYAQQAWDVGQSGMQAIQQAQQFAAALGLGGQRPSSGPAPSPPPSPDAGAGAGAAPPMPQPSQPGGQPMPDQPTAGYGPVGGPPQTGIDQLTALLQALQQRQIPALPGGAPQPAAAPAPAIGTAPPPQADALGLLRVLITNPQLQQALRSGRAGSVTPPPVQLPVPVPDAPTQLQPVQVPIAAVLNALVALSGRAMTELNEQMSEDEPEVPDYLVSPDGDLIVDPASADDRAALVSHLFLLSDAAQRSGWYPQLSGAPEEAEVEGDEAETWARDAGFP